MKQLHVVFFPMVAHGHTIPIIEMAKLFVSRGLKATIVATPSFSGQISKTRESGHDITLKVIEFPPQGSTLPKSITSFEQVPKDLLSVFIEALEMMQQPFEILLQELKPDCVVSDMFLPWTVDSAAKVGIPRLVFHGISYIAMCCGEHMSLYKPFKEVCEDGEMFLLPKLPHELRFLRTQIGPYVVEEEKGGPFVDWTKRIHEADERSYGVVVNSFYDLESAYADHFRKVLLGNIIQAVLCMTYPVTSISTSTSQINLCQNALCVCFNLVGSG